MDAKASVVGGPRKTYKPRPSPSENRETVIDLNHLTSWMKQNIWCLKVASSFIKMILHACFTHSGPLVSSCVLRHSMSLRQEENKCQLSNCWIILWPVFSYSQLVSPSLCRNSFCLHSASIIIRSGNAFPWNTFLRAAVPGKPSTWSQVMFEIWIWNDFIPPLNQTRIFTEMFEHQQQIWRFDVRLKPTS